MRKIIFITVCIFISFLLEFILFNIFGRWFMPNFFIILIIFFNLCFGIRYSLFTGALAGIIKDSFSTSPFGMYLFSFILCAYLTSFLKRYVYAKGSRLSQLILTLLILWIYIFMQSAVHIMFSTVGILEIFQNVLLPETVSTLVITMFTFNHLRQCVLKLSV